MTKDVRIDRLYPGLTALERARLVLQAWKDGTDEHRLVRLTMPPMQAPEFNRYIDLMNGVNQRLALFVLALRLQVDQLSLRFGWLLTLQLWLLQDTELAQALLCQPEPDAGGCESDADADAYLDALRALRRSPVLNDLPRLVGRKPEKNTMRENIWDALSEAIRDGVANRWQEARAVEIVIGEIAEEFESEDPVLPAVREMLDGVRRDLRDLHDNAQPYTGEFDVSEPEESVLAIVRGIAGTGTNTR